MSKRDELDQIYRQDEATCVQQLLNSIQLTQQQYSDIEKVTTQLVQAIREHYPKRGGIDSFMSHYDLSSEQGIALMCLAEALLRIPDKETIDELIKDKLLSAHWEMGEYDSLFVNAATWGLMLTGKLFKNNPQKTLGSTLKKWAQKAGEPVVRKAVNEAIKILSKQFVLGENIEQALVRAKEGEKKGYRYSFDMLGEAARTEEDAMRYFKAYQNAITQVGEEAKNVGPIVSNGVSVKLSALHPRYEMAKHETMLPVLIDRTTELAFLAKKYHIGLTIDAEEADRLDLSLEVTKAIFTHSALKDWEGFGVALQAYQKRAFYVIDWLADLAKQNKKRLMLRLVKGAYWDSEIKDSQVKGLNGYPVFTRKPITDVSYLACAQKIIAAGELLYPQFATHNAYTVAAILNMMGERKDFEFQRLKGMGRSLYDQIIGEFNLPVRIYAPVGEHSDLLAYLVRRLLENGANTSFVNRIVDAKAPMEELTANPVAKVKTYQQIPHPKIPLPEAIYGDVRKNSKGIDLSNITELKKLFDGVGQYANEMWEAAPLSQKIKNGKDVINPATHEVVGQLQLADTDEIKAIVDRAHQATTAWNFVPVKERANCLRKMADLMEENRYELMSLAIREGGKTIPDALAEVREAVDFCRYYAAQAEENLAGRNLPGPTGESNTLQMHGRGVALCISPWNFPLAIFTGQVSAALVAGNPVIAKPAEQTTLIGALAVKLFHQAGIPENVLQLMPASGRKVGKLVVPDERIKCVIFTGSTETAQIINRTLANRSGEIIPFIAETGGQNALIADSTALPEQLIQDVILSAFGSAGQRCSALRVLFLQEDVADKMIKMLKGAMAELKVGNPQLLSTDVGPVIDNVAKEALEKHQAYLEKVGKLIYRISLEDIDEEGTFFGPCAYEIEKLSVLEREVFGPILHVIRFKRSELDKVIAAINNTGYGLTLGIHTRINSLAEYIQSRVHAGNAYVNRNMVGAVVGVQPFGGEGLSGTGPKAGGPHYLSRLCHERSFTINTAAAGGNASLLALND